MRRIVYASFAAKAFSIEELFDLLAKARASNMLRDITGVLFYQDRFFLQCLEGPSVEVAALVDRIHRDPRHQCFTVLSDQALATERLFSSWSMGFFHMAAVEAIAPAGLISNEDAFEAAISPCAGNDPAAVLLRQYWQTNARKLHRPRATTTRPAPAAP